MLFHQTMGLLSSSPTFQPGPSFPCTFHNNVHKETIIVISSRKPSMTASLVTKLSSAFSFEDLYIVPLAYLLDLSAIFPFVSRTSHWTTHHSPHLLYIVRLYFYSLCLQFPSPASQPTEILLLLQDSNQMVLPPYIHSLRMLWKLIIVIFLFYNLGFQSRW